MAKDPSVLAGTLETRGLLAESEKALHELLAVFDAMAEQVRQGGEVSLTDLNKTRTALALARVQVVDEVKRHEKHILQSRGLVADAPLDFEQLRASIGRKLDRIRDTGGAGEISDESRRQ